MSLKIECFVVKPPYKAMCSRLNIITKKSEELLVEDLEFVTWRVVREYSTD